MHSARLNSIFIFSAILLFSISCVFGAQQAPIPDKAGCLDHPLFTRMQGMRIETCKTIDYDSFAFMTGKKTTNNVEGKRIEIRYKTDPPVAPSPLQIIRNHQQAIAKIGGTTIYEDNRYTVLKVSKDGKEIWAQVDTAWGKGYMLTIIEKQEMVQEVIASAELFKAGLNKTGHVEVPGIFFDSGKSDLKPESDPAIAEVAKLLQADPGMKVYVVGHTDNVASLDLNMKLSKARAEAVVQALVTRHGIAQNRLIGLGVGPLSPVASNENEEGRSKNRRVELVKQ
jgi:outer membrane protein OmpA-like peptidoglycan-associated protein